MICKNCGAKIDDGDVFCGQCGESIADAHDTVQNAAMDKQQIIKYLEIGVDLEKQRYLQERTLERLDKEINRLGIAKKYIKPVQKKNNTEIGVYLLVGPLLGGLVGFVSSCVTCIQKWILYNNSDYSFSITLAGALIGLVAGAVIGSCVESQEYTGIKKEYEKQMNAYNQCLVNDRQRVETELAQRKIIESERQALFIQYCKTREALKKYYSKGVLYEKYHNDFTAIASFLDYFKSGMCSTLGEKNGGDGAYNKYEDAVLHRVIINRLDMVLEKLDEIKSNQWEIYNAIKQGNSISDRLLNATTRMAIAGEQTARNSAIAAYNSQEAAKELNQIKWLETFEYLERNH
ncbi:MAG: zinc ribbon domain-containing protein [Clostridia bacterium]|nr:zinc ribbon domain-containing protein [Clostridia bacterium]